MVQKKIGQSKVTISAYSAQAPGKYGPETRNVAMDSSFEDRQKDVNLNEFLSNLRGP